MRLSPGDPRFPDPSRPARRLLRPEISDAPRHLSAIRSPPVRRPAFWLLSASWPPWRRRGATTRKRTTIRASREPPTVRLIQPQVRNLVRVVGQPSFIEAYERTSIYPQARRLHPGVEGRHRRQGEEGPGARHAVHPRAGRGARDQGRDRRAGPGADRAGQGGGGGGQRPTSRRPRRGSRRRRRRSPASRPRSIAGTRRSSGSNARSTLGVVNPQDLLESTNQLKASTASWDAAKATVMKAEAELLSREAALSKAKVDVRVAEADLKVAESEEKRLKALVGYITLFAPFPGVIVSRNANTFDFVLPTTGDPSADPHSPHLSPSGGAAPVYVVDRTDIVRIFVDIPEQDANFVHIGSKATVLVRAYRDQPIVGTRHPHLLGAERQEPDAPRRDRPAQHRQPAPARDVRLRQGDHRAARRAGPAAVGADARRREDLLLDLRGRPRAAGRGPDGHHRRPRSEVQRRPVDRGHQSRRSRRRPAARSSGCRSTARSG